jgi:hypothetical protein
VPVGTEGKCPSLYFTPVPDDEMALNNQTIAAAKKKREEK